MPKMRLPRSWPVFCPEAKKGLFRAGARGRQQAVDPADITYLVFL
jgi:hypothetical protein